MNYKRFKKIINKQNIKYLDIDYEPLEITIELKSPVINLWKMHFDGFLAGVIFQNILRENSMYITAEDSNNKILEIRLPIEKLNINEDYIYKASCFFYETETVLKRTSIKKRFSESNLALLSDIKKVICNSGTYKNRDYPVVYEATLSNLNCFCVGNKAEIKKILQLPISIGKHREKGFGFIKNIKIKSIKKDNSIIYKDSLMRVIPIKMYSKLGEHYKISKEFKDNAYKQCIIGEFNHKPPYFKMRDTELCYQPQY